MKNNLLIIPEFYSRTAEDFDDTMFIFLDEARSLFSFYPFCSLYLTAFLTHESFKR